MTASTHLRRTLLAGVLLGGLIVLPPVNESSMTIVPGQLPTFTYRDSNGTSMIVRPGQLPIFDYDNGGTHMTLIPGQLPTFTYGDGTGEGDGDE